MRAMGNRQVALGLATAVIGFGGFFAVYSYLVPMLTHLTGISDSSTTLVLALFGVGMTLGTLVAGPLTDRALRPDALCRADPARRSAGGLLLRRSQHGAPLVTLTLIAALSALITTPVQMLLMAKADKAPTMAAASNHSAFNLANAGGAWLGGLVISAGWGWASPTLVGGALALAGLGLAIMAASWTGDLPLRGRHLVPARPRTPRGPNEGLHRPRRKGTRPPPDQLVSNSRAPVCAYAHSRPTPRGATALDLGVRKVITAGEPACRALAVAETVHG